MSDNKTHSSRIAAFKNTGRDSQELRRKRVETSVALRRAARDDQLLKRRACSPEDDSNTEPEVLLPPSEIVKGLRSDDLAELLRSARAARRTLSRQQNPPINDMINAGAVSPLVRALDRDDCSDLQFEAAWALTNIASGSHEQTMAVIDGGAVPKLVCLLSMGGALSEQCAWALGNIAGDGAQARDLVLSHLVLPALLPMLQPGKHPASMTRTAVWTVSNLCRNKNPLVDLDQIAPALPYLSELLTVNDTDAMSDTCWSLSYLTDGPNERIELVQTTAELLPRLVAALSHSAPVVQTPALRAVGNMVTGSDVQTDRVLDVGVMPHVINLLNGSKPSLVKEAAWCASNILAGTQGQIQRAIEAGVLPPLVRVLSVCEIKCQKEAAWAVTNLCLGGTGPQLCALLESGMLQPYCALLSSPDPKAVLVVLEGLTNLLQAAEKFGEVEQLCVKLEEEGTLDKLEALQEHENQQIYKKVLHILDTYFAENSDEKNAPEQTEDEFQFGVSGSYGDHIGEF